MAFKIRLDSRNKILLLEKELENRPVDDWANKKQGGQRIGKPAPPKPKQVDIDDSMSFGEGFDPKIDLTSINSVTRKCVAVKYE